MAQKFLLVIDSKKYADFINGDLEELVPELRMGNVGYHRELINEPLERALGGGTYEISADGKDYILCDKSYDYGIPQWHRVDGIVCDTYVKGCIIYKYPKYDCPYMEDVDVKKLFYLK